MSKRKKGGNASAKIEYDQTDSRSFFLGKFANGLVKDEHRKDLHGKLLTHKNRTDQRTKNNKTVVMESSSMTYIGKNHGPTSLNSAKGTLRQYVGIYDEKTGKMRVCDAEMFHMVPFIPGLDKVQPETPDKEKSYVEKFGSLVEAFGSKKKKQSFEKKHRNRIDAAEMEGVMAVDARHGQEHVRSRQEEKERLAEQIDSLSALPVCNKDAENVEDVYTLDTVVTQSELDLLQNLAQDFFNCTADNIREWSEKKKYPLYVLTHLATMPVDESLRWQRCKLLVYLHSMLRLYSVSPSQLNQPKSFSELPQTIRHKLFDNFTVRVRQSRCKPTRLKDRLAAFVLVLCLHIDEFSTDIDDITCDLHIGRHKAVQILRALGCQVKRKIKDKAEHFVGTLALPLQFPLEASKGGGKRRR
ncbi:DNA-directed RNA polymerase I subunit RPA49-like [Mya arenaria]|uniref:DNA-directed RNA polymerase I subunit RPA49-like n=1 Tax=Mya arenaria TaxID=6604 RepID=UPI0022E0B553|nr:DNA-directed RNA polymerase I subunit RPA49-like [Mya arenaria]